MDWDSFWFYQGICSWVTKFLIFSLIMLIMLINIGNRKLKAVIKHRMKPPGVENYKAPLIVGFFHPFCDALAGGEKVLFAAIEALQKDKSMNLKLAVYSGSDVPKAKIFA